MALFKSDVLFGLYATGLLIGFNMRKEEQEESDAELMDVKYPQLCSSSNKQLVEARSSAWTRTS